MASNQQREAFRVRDQVYLDWHTVDAYTAEHEDPGTLFNDDGTLAVLKDLHQFDGQAAQLARQVDRQQRPLLELFTLLNRKINCLSQAFVARATDWSHHLTPVNLSDKGIAFVADKAVYKGSYLALRLVFLPAYTSVILFAKVVRSEPVSAADNSGAADAAANSDRFHIAADFQRLNAADQQILANQVMAVQRRQAQREQRNVDDKA